MEKLKVTLENYYFCEIDIVYVFVIFLKIEMLSKIDQKIKKNEIRSFCFYAGIINVRDYWLSTLLKLPCNY